MSVCLDLRTYGHKDIQTMSLIEFRNISKSFGDHQVLSGLNLAVKQGETLTIIGGSGSGKSVTLKLLLGLLDADDGGIFFRGANIVDMTREGVVQMRSRIGMLFQGGRSEEHT